MSNFIEDYLDSQAGTEPPTIYHRWCAIAGIGAILGRNCYIQHGRNQIFPNQYLMLVGESGTRKDTAIRGIKQLLIGAGYKTFVADKLSKEKFLLDLEAGFDHVNGHEFRMDVTKGEKKNPTMQALFGEELSNEPAECLITAGEFNAFLGHGNIEFIDLFTNLWDYSGVYENRIKTGHSVRIPNPTINILSGNTNIGISMAFPTEVIGQGFFSRLIMIFSDPSGRRITWPPIPDTNELIELSKQLAWIRDNIKGEMILKEDAKKSLSEIYENWRDLDDVRFKSYSTRRFTHLLKLCIICTASAKQLYTTSKEVQLANSIMHYTEFWMPKALGEFGKARNSDVTSKVLTLLEKTDVPLDIIKDLWPQVRRDLDNQKQLGDILQGLRMADKIQALPNGKLLIKKKPPNFKFPWCEVGLLREYKETLGEII